MLEDVVPITDLDRLRQTRHGRLLSKAKRYMDQDSRHREWDRVIEETKGPIAQRVQSQTLCLDRY